jgi:hypothetical protein
MRSPEVMERHLHSAPTPGASLLRASVGARLGVVAAAVVLLWLAVLWALA